MSPVLFRGGLNERVARSYTGVGVPDNGDRRIFDKNMESEENRRAYIMGPALKARPAVVRACVCSARAN